MNFDPILYAAILAVVIAFVAGDRRRLVLAEVETRQAVDFGVESAWEIYTSICVVNGKKIDDNGKLIDFKYSSADSLRAISILRRCNYLN